MNINEPIIKRHNPSPMTANPGPASATHKSVDEAVLHVAATLAAGCIHAAARDCSTQSVRSEASAMRCLTIGATLTNGILDASIKSLSALECFIDVSRDLMRQSSKSASEKSVQYLLDCIAFDMQKSDKYEFNSCELEHQSREGASDANRCAMEILCDISSALAYTAAEALGAASSLPKRQVGVVRLAVRALLLSGVEACRKVEEAAKGELASREALVSAARVALRSELVRKTGPMAELLVLKVEARVLFA